MSATESAQTVNSESMSGDEENNMAWTKLAKTAQPKTRKEACNSSCSGRYLENKNTDGSEVCWTPLHFRGNQQPDLKQYWVYPRSRVSYFKSQRLISKLAAI